MWPEDIINTSETSMKYVGIKLLDDDKKLLAYRGLPKMQQSLEKNHFIDS